MVEIITDAIVGDTSLIPKVSPIKYRKGWKKANSRISLKSFLLIFCNFLNNTEERNNKKDDIINLNNIRLG